MERSIQEILKNQAVWDVWREMPSDSKEKYQAYLCSREWALLRNQVMERCGGICERCRANKADAVHHLHYSTKYHESLDDLRAFCHGCHEYTHGKSDIDPRIEAVRQFPQQGLNASLATSSIYGECPGRFPESAVCCPVCEGEYSHIKDVVYNPNGRNQGQVTISMWGECGHTWDIVIYGHKGNAFAYTDNHGIDAEESHA